MTDAALDATDLARLVQQGEVSPLELVDEAIDRIERHNPAINAVIHPRYEAARAEASGDLPDGPFRGVPFLIKDLGCTIAGEPHHRGCLGLKRRDVRSSVDSHLYRRFRDSGLVTLGRTNTPEFGSTVTTEPVAFGPTRSPWNLDHSVGGSSGGSAAAVAAGLVPMAHANDGGGSIRVPASECGLVGLKPSRGRVSHGPEAGEGWAGATIDGVVSRTVRDTATALDVMAGPESGDPYFAAPPQRPYADEVGTDPGPLKIGLAPTVAAGDTHPECVAAVEAAGGLLESLGHAVSIDQPAAMAEEAFSQHFLTILLANAARDFDVMAAEIGEPLTADEVEADNWAGAELGRSISAAQYLEAVQWTHQWQRRLAGWWDTEGFDIMVSPVIATPPPEIGWLRDPELGSARLTSILLFTAQFNTSGQPAVSLPLHQSADGLPVGVQFVAGYGREDLLIRLAAQIESAAPWSDRHPPLFG
ncbi:MAG: amidase [Acidimicrobiales bacterium]